MPRDLIAHPETPVVDEVGQLLLAAADHIERFGWCQGEMATVDGRRCALGAIIYERNARYDNGVYTAAVRRLHSVVTGRFLSLPQWNDMPGRTKDEVVATLRKVARS